MVSGKTLGQLNAFGFIVTVAIGSTPATILLSESEVLLSVRSNGSGDFSGVAQRHVCVHDSGRVLAGAHLRHIPAASFGLEGSSIWATVLAVAAIAAAALVNLVGNRWVEGSATVTPAMKSRESRRWHPSATSRPACRGSMSKENLGPAGPPMASDSSRPC